MEPIWLSWCFVTAPLGNSCDGVTRFSHWDLMFNSRKINIQIYVHLFVLYRHAEHELHKWLQGPSITRWRHEMEPLSALLTLCEGIHLSLVAFLSKILLMRSFDNVFIVSPRCLWGNWLVIREASMLMFMWRHRNGSVSSKSPKNPRILQQLILHKCNDALLCS